MRGKDHPRLVIVFRMSACYTTRRVIWKCYVVGPLNNSRKINNDSSCFGQNGMTRLNSISDEVIVGNKGCTLHMEYNREQDVSITIRRWYFDDIHTHSPCAQMLVLNLGSV